MDDLDYESPPPRRLPAGLIFAVLVSVLAVVVLVLALQPSEPAWQEAPAGPGWLETHKVLVAFTALFVADIILLVSFARDIRRRAPEQAALWCLVLLIGGLLGAVLWLAARPPLPRD